MLYILDYGAGSEYMAEASISMVGDFASARAHAPPSPLTCAAPAIRTGPIRSRNPPDVRSLSNSILKLGYPFRWVSSPSELTATPAELAAQGKPALSALLFPGVGSFGGAVASLAAKGYTEPLKAYLASGRPYMGICIGMQALFESSEEERGGTPGLGVVPGKITKFTSREGGGGGGKSVPQMGWNQATPLAREDAEGKLLGEDGLEEARRYGLVPSSSSSSSSSGGKGAGEHFYFVHSFRASFDPAQHADWALTLTQYGEPGTDDAEVFVSSIAKGNIFATQFHPEKSGRAGLELLRAWLQRSLGDAPASASASEEEAAAAPDSQQQQVQQQQQRDTGRVRNAAEQLKTLTFGGLTKRVVACLDVRSNDDGDLVVTKGESYDVREKAEPAPASLSAAEPAAEASSSSGAPAQQQQQRAVRNLGKPVDLAHRYYLEGADEIVFLNITSFRSSPLKDQPMLDVLKRAAAECFVPLCIGGGIKDFVEPGDDGRVRSAKEVADEYFRAGADKVSIGSEAVLAVEEILQRQNDGLDDDDAAAAVGEKRKATDDGKGDAAQSSAAASSAVGRPRVTDPALVSDRALTGKTGIEMINAAYGAQAVVVSIDPRRVYLAEGEAVDPAHAPCVVVGERGSGEKEENVGRRWWYRCTIKGGREDRDLDVVQLARGVERLGAGELLLNSIDRDGSNAGFDRLLIDLVRRSVRIPVVASSGAGVPHHFSDIFTPQPLREGERPSSVEAALAAGIFHRQECTIAEVKQHLVQQGFPVRNEDVKQGAGAVVEKSKEQAL